MIVIVAVDDNGGMLFCKRRQSMDRVLRQDVLRTAENARLWMNQYSRKQFEEAEAKAVIVEESYLEQAQPGEYCFVEQEPLKPYLNNIEKMICYRWNRVYPADVHLDIDLSDETWRLESVTEFAGYSHDKITKEVWESAR